MRTNSQRLFFFVAAGSGLWLTCSRACAVDDELLDVAVLKEKQEVNNMEEEDRQRELDKKEEKKRRRAQKAAENPALLEEAAAEEYKAETRARTGALPFAARLRPCLSSQLVSSVLPSLPVHFFPSGMPEDDSPKGTVNLIRSASYTGKDS